MRPVERYEEVEIDNEGPYRYRREAVVDVGGERTEMARRFVNVVWLLVVIAEIFIWLRVALRLIGANPANAFANFIYVLTDILLLPFLTIAGAPGEQGFVLDIPAIIGALVYLLFGWVATKLLWLLLKPARRRVERRVDEVE